MAASRGSNDVNKIQTFNTSELYVLVSVSSSGLRSPRGVLGKLQFQLTTLATQWERALFFLNSLSQGSRTIPHQTNLVTGPSLNQSPDQRDGMCWLVKLKSRAPHFSQPQRPDLFGILMGHCTSTSKLITSSLFSSHPWHRLKWGRNYFLQWNQGAVTKRQECRPSSGR